MKNTIAYTTSLISLFIYSTAFATEPDLTKAKVINIEAPLKNHISFNTFESLSSNEHGLIFNNDVNSNGNLTTKAAKMILAEVTGAEESQLQGIIGIKGETANLVIANPNGITWKDGSVHNISSLSLVVGQHERQFIKNRENQTVPKALEDYSQLKFSVAPTNSLLTLNQQTPSPIQLSKLNVIADKIKLQNAVNINAAMQNYISASGNVSLSIREGVVKHTANIKTTTAHTQGNHLNISQDSKLSGQKISLESHQYQCKESFLCPQNKIDIQGVIQATSLTFRGDSEITIGDKAEIRIGKNLHTLISRQ